MTITYLWARAILACLVIGKTLAIAVGDKLQVECISRNIDNGEHIFDAEKNIVYKPFAKCQQTGRPLELAFMKDETINCTFSLEDELYHLFQMYLHEDVPWSCRVTVGKITDAGHSKGKDGLDLDDDDDHNDVESNGYRIPIPLSMNGELHDSHLKIDPEMTILMLANSDEDEQFRIRSGIGMGNGLINKRNRYVIDDSINFQFNVRWYPRIDSYNGGKVLYQYCLMTFALTSTCFVLIFFGFLQRRKKHEYNKLE